ncbi:MATE family efflux transporter [Clostridium sp.]|uniref:MATE family efflux transporter n=1 Tax=Clostridium sp. TaxID=1506 RepID=UPI002FC58E6E
MSKRLNLLEDDIRKIFLHYLLPSIGGMLGLSLYIFFDTMFIGQGVGSEGLAALSIAIPIYNVHSALGLLLGVGGATVLSIYHGEENHRKANETFTISFFITVFLGILLTVVEVIYIDELCYFLGANEELFPLVKEYLRILTWFTWAFILSGSMVVMVRNDKNPKLAMWAMLAGCISNIFLDWLFIMGFNMGMTGAIVATVISPIITLSILSIHFTKKINTIKLVKIKLDIALIMRILRNGVASFILEISGAIVIFAFNKAVFSHLGDLGISAYSIIANISLICASIFTGVAQAVQPIISINFGAKKVSRINKSIKYALITSIILGVLIYAIGLVMPGAIVLIFNNDNAELMKITVKGIRLYFISFLFMGINIVIVSYLQSMERSKISIFSSLCRGIIFILIGLLILPKLFSVNGVWLTVAFAELITLGINIIYLVINKKHLTV